MTKTIHLNKDKTAQGNDVLQIPERHRIKLLQIMTEIETRLFFIKGHCYEIGKYLSEAKELIPHGSFQAWIEDHFKSEFPYSTAHAYMKIYEVFKGKSKLVHLMPIHFLMDMTRKTFPDEIRKIVEDNAEFIKKDEVEQLKVAHQLFKSGEIDLKEFEKLAEKQIKLGIQIHQGKANQRLSHNMRKTLNYGTQDILKAIAKVRKQARQMQHLFAPAEGCKEQAALISEIDGTIKSLQKLKEDIEGKSGMVRTVNFKNPLEGKKMTANL